MYTLIEIFDAKQYENIIAPVSLNISRLIYIGTKEVMTEKKINNIKNFFSARKFKVPCKFIYTERDNSRSVLDTLEHIVKNNDNCIFDVTGGEDVLLSSVGITAHKFSIPVIRIDLRKGEYVSVYKSAPDLKFNFPCISARESLMLQGARIIKSTPVSKENIFNKNDVHSIFEINKNNCEAYSSFCNVFAEFISRDTLTFSAHHSLLKKKFSYMSENAEKIFNSLISKRLITLKNSGEEIHGKLKNDTVYHCLVKAGNALEVYTALSLKELSKPHTSLCDINLSTSVDWDDKKQSFETQNEIDIIAIYDSLPVFISCKNGEIKKEALYELDAVSRALGGAYSKKILVASYISKSEASRKHFIKRASDMGINLIYDIHKKSPSEFKTLLKKILAF